MTLTLPPRVKQIQTTEEIDPLNLPPLPLYIDSTIINAFKSCRQKWRNAHLFHLKPPGQSVHLVAGAAFAGGIEGARRYAFKCQKEDRHCHHDDMLAAAFTKFQSEWGYDSPRFEGHAKSFENTFCGLEYYLSHFPPLFDNVQPLLSPDGEPLVEFTFALPLDGVRHPDTGDPFIYCGRFDMLGHVDGLTVILDEKTTGALGDYWLKQWDMRGQFLGYCWATSKLGYPVRNVIVRGVALQKTQYNLLPCPVQYAPHMLDRWYEETCYAVAELVAAYQANRFSYNLGDACTAYGGCAYKLLCQSPPGANWFSEYEISHWDPLHKGN